VIEKLRTFPEILNVYLTIDNDSFNFNSNVVPTALPAAGFSTEDTEGIRKELKEGR